MQGFLAPLKELVDFPQIMKSSQAVKGYQQIRGGVSSQKTHMMYALGEDYKYKIIVLANEEKAKSVYEEYRFLEENVFYYPPKDLLFFHADIKSKNLFSQRLEVLKQLLEAEQSEKGAG